MKRAKSARGETVDFDLLAVKQNLSAAPVPVSVHQRRRFIDERDGIRKKENFIVGPVMSTEEISEDSPLAAAAEAVKSSKNSKK